jgi:hypothetical protein
MQDYHMSLDKIPPPALFLLLLLALTCSGACSGSSTNDGNAPGTDASDGRPEITEEKIRQNINGRTVEGVPDEANTARPISWTFEPDEPKEFTVLEKKMDGDKATLVIDMKTRSAEGSDHPRQLSGQIRLHYELHTDFVMRWWRIVDVDNISMKYRNEPKKENKQENKNDNKKDAPKDDEEQDADEGE